jgi:hypothetical protein
MCRHIWCRIQFAQAILEPTAALHWRLRFGPFGPRTRPAGAAGRSMAKSPSTTDMVDAIFCGLMQLGSTMHYRRVGCRGTWATQGVYIWDCMLVLGCTLNTFVCLTHRVGTK